MKAVENHWYWRFQELRDTIKDIKASEGAAIPRGGKQITEEPGWWETDWLPLDVSRIPHSVSANLTLPKHLGGICREYLQPRREGEMTSGNLEVLSQMVARG